MCGSIDYGKLQLRSRKRRLNFVSNQKLIKRQNRDGCGRFFLFFFVFRHSNTKTEDKLDAACGTHSEEYNYSQNNSRER